MTAFPDDEITRCVDIGHDIAVSDGHFGKGAETVQRGDQLRGFLNPADVSGDPIAHGAEEVVFQFLDAVTGSEEAVFQLFQFGRKIALVGNQGLFTDKMLRDLRFNRGFRHINIVAEDPVVADLELPDAGALAFPFFQRGDFLRAVVSQLAQFVQLGRKAVADDPAFTDGERRIVTDAAVDVLPDIRQEIHRGDLLQGRALRGLQQFLQTGQYRDAVGEHAQIPAAGTAVYGAADQPLHVADFLQRAHQLRAADMIREQLPNRVQPSADRGDREQRPLYPGAQHTAAHGGTGPIQHPQQTPLLFAAAHGLCQLQAAARGVVQLHIAAAEKDIQAVDV